MSKMIECKNCGYRFEREIKRCPNCKAPAPINIKAIIYTFVAVALVIALIIGAVNMFLDFGNTEEPSSSSTKTNSFAQSDTSDESSSGTASEQNNSTSSSTVIDAVTQNSSANTYKKPTDNDNNVTVASDGTVSITVPKWFLFKIEPDYNYQLTDKEANMYKFKSVTKNADGSATFKVGYNDYHGFLLIAKSGVNAVVNEYSTNTWCSKIESDDGYNNIKIYTKHNSLSDFDEGFGIYISLSGLQATFYQYMHYNYSVGTTITVYNKNNTVLATYKFPELLQQN